MKSSYSDGFFDVSRLHGFLPIKDPYPTLPLSYPELQDLMEELHHVLQTDSIQTRVEQIPDYSHEIQAEQDPFVLQAIYRAYCFLVSGYTLEKAHKESTSDGYGKARRIIPSHIAKPFVLVSERLHAFPWLDYHYAYALGNYVKRDAKEGLDWKNLKMACSFTGTSDETGFIMLHVYINELSPSLVASVLNYTETRHSSSLQECASVMKDINQRRREMWSASRHERYNDFRVFIMGIEGNQSIFGDGVIYEGCFDNQPQRFRGQTGAQDNIIPFMDIFTGIVDYYPENKLTEYLMDLRKYRPVCIQEFLHDARTYYKANPVLATHVKERDVQGLLSLLEIVDQVYLFRNGHWQFVQKYIMANVTYPVATGGTPITSWLVNQIEAVLEYERVILGEIERHVVSSDSWFEPYQWFQTEWTQKRLLLESQIQELSKHHINVESLYQFHKTVLEDKC